MKLTYRGVQYQEENHNSSNSVVAIQNQEIIYRGNSLKVRIKPKFPWLNYIKQLFRQSESKPVFDPITFWYAHKRKFIESCWFADDVEKLDRAWDLTLAMEKAKSSKSKQKTKLKYRGVTYYK
ncbi:MAG TPA: DUF4278 domain-containing protein [Coleofasciculaceae cyanobacterium]